MHVFQKYERLEALGLWRAEKGGQRREVVLTFGTNALILSDINNNVLTHWALDAIVTEKADGEYMLYRPGGDAEETVEISDQQAIDALADVLAVLRESHRSNTKILRWSAGIITSIIFAAALIFGPQVIDRYTAQILPQSAQAEIGHKIVDRINTAITAQCTTPEGNFALRALLQRLNVPTIKHIYVFPINRDTPLLLPGGIVVLTDKMLSENASTDIVAGYVIAADLAIQAHDPFLALLHETGSLTSMALLTSDGVEQYHINTLTNNAIGMAMPALSAETLIEGFTQNGLSTTLFAQKRNAMKAHFSNSDLSKNDPFPAGTAEPVLKDGAWLGLRAICRS